MKVFYVSRKNKINALISTIIALGFFVFLTGKVFQLAGDFTSGIAGMLFVAFIAFGMLMTVIFCFWAGLYAVVSWDAHLIFDNQHMELNTIKWARYLPWYGLASFSVEYEQIHSITVSPFFEKVTITTHDGRAYIVLPTWFDGNFGDAVLLALQSRAPQGAFTPDMDVPVAAKRWAKLHRLQSSVSIPLMCLILFLMVFNPQNSFFINSWHEEKNKSEYVKIHSVDEDGKFWTAGWMFNGYGIYHLPGENKWMLMEDQYGESDPQFVSGDKNGFPIVWIDTGVFHYEIDDWRFIPYKNNLDLNMQFADSQGLASGTQSLVIEAQEQQIIAIDALTGEWSVVPLPEDVNQQEALPASMRRAMNGDVLVLMLDDLAASVYVFSGGEWMPQKYPVSMTDGFVKDYFLDNDDSLWVLLDNYSYFVIEKIELNGNVSKTQLPFQGDVSVEQLIVDASERLWVAERFSDVLTIFDPVWDGTAVEVVQYTEHNSNYRSGDMNPLEMASDGRVWSFGEKIVTMDATVEKLPSPFPAWYASLNFDTALIFLELIYIGWVVYFKWAFRK